jgi:hypothetical protein
VKRETANGNRESVIGNRQTSNGKRRETVTSFKLQFPVSGIQALAKKCLLHFPGNWKLVTGNHCPCNLKPVTVFH